MASKYEALEIYLKDRVRSKSQVALSFKEIENIIGQPLPQSAFKYREWWSNQRDVSNRPQSKAWLSAGYEVDSVRLSSVAGLVNFRSTT